ncbi:DUF1194 domain-containing protein [Shimia sp. W99]
MIARLALSLMMTCASLVPARACDVALLLAVDVSGSIDPLEYKVQMEGLAAGLRDGVVVEALVRGQSAVALMQWTGEGRQELVLPWFQVRSPADAEAFAQAVEAMPRVWDKYSTAVGEAMLMALKAFESAPACLRKVVDVSGDGFSNEGLEPAKAREAMVRADVTVNALVIETNEIDLTAYFWENVITGAGAFVVTANGFPDYPARIRQKLIRELARQMSSLAP